MGSFQITSIRTKRLSIIKSLVLESPNPAELKDTKLGKGSFIIQIFFFFPTRHPGGNLLNLPKFFGCLESPYINVKS